MSQLMICRLCLNDKLLINIFDDRLTNSEELRKFVLLGTGVEIQNEDVVTKYICQYCSDIAIFLYKYRKNALANDKALKKFANQQFVEPSLHARDVANFNGEIVDLLTKKENEEAKRKRAEEKKKTSAAVHPTVISLIKTRPKLKVPNDILKCDIQPKLFLDRRVLDNWKPSSKRRRITTTIRGPISDIERFKLKCPGVNIKKISSESSENEDPDLIALRHKAEQILQTLIENENHNVEMARCKSTKTSLGSENRDKDTETLRYISSKLSMSSENRNYNSEMPRCKPGRMPSDAEDEDNNAEKSRRKSMKTSVSNKNTNNNGEILRLKSVKISLGNENKDHNDERPHQKSAKTSLGAVENKDQNAEKPRPKSMKLSLDNENKDQNAEKPRPKSMKLSLDNENKDQNAEKPRPKSMKLSLDNENKNHKLSSSKQTKDKSRHKSNKISLDNENKRHKPMKLSLVSVESKEHSVEKHQDKATKTSSGTENKEKTTDNNVSKKKSISEAQSSTSRKRKSKDRKPLDSETKVKSRKRAHSSSENASEIRSDLKLRISLRTPSSESSCKENSNQLTVLPEAVIIDNSHSWEAEKSASTVTPTMDSEVVLLPALPIESLLPESDSERILPKKLNRTDVFASDSDNESIGADMFGEDPLDTAWDNEPAVADDTIAEDPLNVVPIAKSEPIGLDNTFVENLLTTVEEQIVLPCSSCNKMFNTEFSLKCHERSHRNCMICKGIFRSEEALKYHQNEVCFKAVIANPPNLELKRVDKQPEITKMFPSAFFDEAYEEFPYEVPTLPTDADADDMSDVQCISDEEDNDDVIFIQDNSNSIVQDRENFVNNNVEYQHIRYIFAKYKDVKFPIVSKTRSTITKAQIQVKYNQKKEITFENMSSELLSYRIPVELLAKQTSFAYVSFSKKTPETNDIYCWANEPVATLRSKNLPGRSSPSTGNSVTLRDKDANSKGRTVTQVEDSVAKSVEKTNSSISDISPTETIGLHPETNQSNVIPTANTVSVPKDYLSVQEKEIESSMSSITTKTVTSSTSNAPQPRLIPTEKTNLSTNGINPSQNRSLWQSANQSNGPTTTNTTGISQYDSYQLHTTPVQKVNSSRCSINTNMSLWSSTNQSDVLTTTNSRPIPNLSTSFENSNQTKSSWQSRNQSTTTTNTRTIPRQPHTMPVSKSNSTTSFVNSVHNTMLWPSTDQSNVLGTTSTRIFSQSNPFHPHTMPIQKANSSTSAINPAYNTNLQTSTNQSSILGPANTLSIPQYNSVQSCAMPAQKNNSPTNGMKTVYGTRLPPSYLSGSTANKTIPQNMQLLQQLLCPSTPQYNTPTMITDETITILDDEVQRHGNLTDRTVPPSTNESALFQTLTNNDVPSKGKTVGNVSASTAEANPSISTLNASRNMQLWASQYTAPRPPPPAYQKDSSFGLRVKAPWELNTI